MTGRLTGKVALVTGGCGGIGRAICDRFAREGAAVFAGDLSARGSLGGAAHEVPGGTFVKLDVTDETSVKEAFRVVDSHCGCLDVLVNAAGIEIEKTIEETSLDEWNHIFAINVTGTFLTSKHALPRLRRSKKNASIVNFGSYDGFIADPGLAAYCATKGAVHALTRAMACDHGPKAFE